ncbi:MAG: helix-turn-helix domain-containing protein [Intestinibacillus sp.]
MAFAWRTADIHSIFEHGRLPHILSVGMEDFEARKTVRAMHRHDDRLELLLIQQGSGMHTIDGQSYRVAKGDVLIYNCNAVHDECAGVDHGMSVLSCAMSGLCIQGLRANCLVPPNRAPVVRSKNRYQELESLLAMMYDFTMQHTPRANETAAYLCAALVSMVYDLIMSETEELRTEEQILGQRIRAYIDANYLEDISLGSIADALHMNQYYMAHVFKAVSGYSPMQYIIRRRIGEAQSYLLQTDKSITEIAMTVGYNNANHFHAAFLKIVGMPPQKYREYLEPPNKEK